MTHETSESAMPGDEALDRAAVTLRDTPVPPGPSPRLMRQTLAALRRAENSSRARSIFLNPVALRIAAIILLALGTFIAALMITGRHYRIIVKHTAPQSPPQPVAPSSQPANLDPLHHDIPQTPEQQNPSQNEPELAEGTISGRVLFVGVPPQPRALPGVNLMPDCAKMHGDIYDESLVVNRNGALANVVISISSGLSGWLKEEYPPPGEVILDQKGCTFVPHVIAVMVGQTLLVKNSDPVLHNVHFLAVNNQPANLGQPTIGEIAAGPFEEPEVFRVKCDVHPWMQAWIRVVDNPYFAVTGPDGRFVIHGLPAGTYTLKAWHEQLGVKEMPVTLAPNRGSALDFSFLPIGK